MSKERPSLFLMVLSFLLFTVSISDSQEIPSLKEIQVSANVRLNNGQYAYSYSITNGVKNTGKVYSVDINIAYPKDGAILSSEGLTIPKGKKVQTFEQSIPPFAEKMIPVGIEKPIGWITGLSVYGTAGWGSRSGYELLPGSNLMGFELKSYGLPIIRDFRADPWIDVNEFYPSVDELESDDEVNALMAKIKQDKENAAFKGKTVGPTAPPADFKPADFLNNIINMKHEAYKLGWIKNEGILKSLDAKLDNAKKDIEKGNTRSARNMLKAFINEVEAQGCESYENCSDGKHLTSEAYGLLKYNAQYLVDHL